MSDGQSSPSDSPSGHLGGWPVRADDPDVPGSSEGAEKWLQLQRSTCTDHFTDTVFSAHLLFSFSLSSLICFASWYKPSQEVNQMFPEQYRNAGGSHVLCSGVFSMFTSFLSVLPVVFCSVFLPVFSLHCDWLSPPWLVSPASCVNHSSCHVPSVLCSIFSSALSVLFACVGLTPWFLPLPATVCFINHCTEPPLCRHLPKLYPCISGTWLDTIYFLEK